ncbi:MAG TPA: hypothetical protein VFV93_11255 [Thermomicrobiales bacterium]|nr:hypothetical protein [Thermomicrobiales bacterium]
MLLQLIRPRGGTVSDGIRLAAINGFGLIVSALLIGFISLILRWLDFPVLLIGFGLVVILVAAAVVFWFRYASAHGKAARTSQRNVRPDVFGAIAAIPFALVGLFLVANGLFGLFLAMVTFSLSRAGDGLERLLFAVIFLGLAATNIIIARAASD